MHSPRDSVNIPPDYYVENPGKALSMVLARYLQQALCSLLALYLASKSVERLVKAALDEGRTVVEVEIDDAPSSDREAC